MLQNWVFGQNVQLICLTSNESSSTVLDLTSILKVPLWPNAKTSKSSKILPKNARRCGKKVAWARAWVEMDSSQTVPQLSKTQANGCEKLEADMSALAVCNGDLASSNSCSQCLKHPPTWGHLAGSLSSLRGAIENIGHWIEQSDVRILRSKFPKNLPNWFGAKSTIGSPTIWLGCCLPQHDRVAMVKFGQIPFASFFSSCLSIFA